MDHQEAVVVFFFVHHRTAPAPARRSFAGRRAKTCTSSPRSVDIGSAPGAVASCPALMSLVPADLEWGVREGDSRATSPSWCRPFGQRCRQVADAGLAADREPPRALAHAVVRDAC